MVLRFLLVLCLLPTLAFADGTKRFMLTGATWNTPSGEKQTPVKIFTIEEDALGRVSSVSNKGAGTSSDFKVLYSQDRCSFSFVDFTGVTIKAELSWRSLGAKTYEITIAQKNEVPETVIGKDKYPRKTITKNSKILLKFTGDQEYSWAEGDSQYVCYPGDKLVWDYYYKETQETFRTVLDGRTSDASQKSSLKMMYFQKENSVVGKQYWQYDLIPWEGNEAAWYKGGQIEYSGDSLLSSNPLTNVVNYAILSTRFGSDAWSYFGPSLFGIPIR